MENIRWIDLFDIPHTTARDNNTVGCDIHLYIEKKVAGKGWRLVETPDIYNGRNYDLFGFLAGVRGDNQHFDQKGFPDDAGPELSEIREYYGSDGHSDSYLTLEELQTVDWESDTFMLPQYGIMDNVQWERFQESIKSGKPDYSLRYPYWQGGGDPKTSSYHKWKVPISIEFDDFYAQVIKELPILGDGCKPSDIRIVFWFDN